MKLTIDSVCLLSCIIDKMEIDEKFINDMINLGKTAKGKSREDTEKLKTQIGMKIMLRIGSKLYLVKTELTEFIMNYKGISEKDAKEQDLASIIKELMKDEGFVSFFKQAAMSK
ncbi:MAG: hypothetical protein HFJ52_04065 [Clostridia bacterium]|nr:hypothetical protein [Clostridia bacterium]